MYFVHVPKLVVGTLVFSHLSEKNFHVCHLLNSAEQIDSYWVNNRALTLLKLKSKCYSSYSDDNLASANEASMDKPSTA